MQAGGYYHYVFAHIAGTYFSRKNTMIRGSTLVLLDAVQWRDTFVSAMFITMLIWFVISTLNKNNGDKFDRRKSMRATDEKLIINELGP